MLNTLLLALIFHTALCRITTSEKRTLLLAEDASRLTRNEAKATRRYDYMSIFGSSKPDDDGIVDVSNVEQENTAPATTTTLTTTSTSTTTTTTTTSSSMTSSTNKNMIQSLHELIQTQPHLTPTSDNPTTIQLSRKENINSFLDGMSVMNDDGPNPRDVSNAFGSRPKAMLNSFRATDMLWAFGQFIVHDISLVNVNHENCNVPIPPNDPYLDPRIRALPLNRSMYELDPFHQVAQQVSNYSAFIDANNVYGNTKTRLEFIRSDDSEFTGRLRTSGSNLLPKNTEGLSNRGGDGWTDLFLAGDTRANENVGLTAIHILWTREHNHWADELRISNPELSGDDIFSMARVIVQAEMQKIVYDEFLPALLGHDAIPPYTGFNPSMDSRLENIVSSCALRIGHTMVGPEIHLDFGNKILQVIQLEAAFFAPFQIERIGGIDAFLRGMANNICQEVDPFITPAMRNHLFSNLDLLAINIQRARDHGIPDFNTIRESLGFGRLGSFGDFLFEQELASVYSDTDQIDCWIGMNSEPRIDGLMVGETQRTILARNFASIRDGDPNFYKNSITDTELLGIIESTTFADVIRRNSDQPGSLDDVRDNLFFFS